MIKAAFLNPNIPPRVVSLINRINQENIEVEAFFFAVTQKNRQWDLKSKEYQPFSFKYHILNSVSLGFGISDFHNSFVSFDLYSKLVKFNPDVVILPGWADLSAWIAFCYAKRHYKKVVIRSESTVNESSWRRTLFHLPVKKLLNHVDHIIASSSGAADYAKTLSATTPVTKIFSSFDTVSFAKKIKQQLTNKSTHKKSLALQKNQQTVYFNGQLIKRKGVLELLQAFSQPELESFNLLISGDGPLKSLVEKYQHSHNNIKYLGHVSQDKLPKLYAVADIFILPSYEETWGLVVIEALAAGLPIIVSNKVGASELIQPKTNGLILKNITSAEITSSIKKMVNLNQKIIKANNRKLALKKLNYEVIAKQFRNLITKVYNNHHFSKTKV